jgi:hypothetical protein
MSEAKWQRVEGDGGRPGFELRLNEKELVEVEIVSTGSILLTTEDEDADTTSVCLSQGQWRAMCALPMLPAPAIADGTSQPWTPPVDRGAEVERLTRERDEAQTRAAEIEAELSTAYAAVDEARDARRGSDRDRLRHKLITAAVRSGRHGVAAVRDADEALAEIDRTAKAKGAKLTRAAFVPPGKGPSAKAVAVALQAIGWTPPYLDMAVEELTHVTAPDWDEAAHALACAALCVGEALRATQPFVTPSADTARGKARGAEREALVARLRGEA